MRKAADRRRPGPGRLGVGLWLCILIGYSAAGSCEVLVAAASSIRGPLDATAARFTNETGAEVRVSYGASGNLTQQILRGAPYDLFLSADEEFPQRLVAADKVRGGPVVYALGRLVLFVPTGSSINIGKGLDGIRESLARGELRHVATAHTELAPYGRAAAQVLRSAGLWDSLAGRIVIGNSVARAAQFASSGSVDAAFISLSLAISAGLVNNGRYQLLPETMHDPLRHAMVLLERARPDASRFFDYLLSRESRHIFEQGGFSLPLDD